MFDRYVAGHLHDPLLAGLSVESHVFNLTAMATGMKIPIGEIFEEVGPLSAAIIRARRERQDGTGSVLPEWRHPPVRKGDHDEG
ncbi:MAG: hypothetical protein KF694_12635 [Mesorhizobium sp.]|nr:hypothetical protein [Mesorhizobium sp.]